MAPVKIRRLNFSRKHARGVTLAELIFCSLILALSFILTRFGVNMITTLYQYQAVIESQRAAEVTMSRLFRELRSAGEIIDLEPNKLVFTAFNTERGYDSDLNDLFNPVNIGTVTYQYVTDANNVAYLQRTVEFPASAGRRGQNVLYHEDSKLCQNLLVAPDLTDVSTVKNTCLFAPTYGWAAPPFLLAQSDRVTAVKLSIRVRPAFSPNSVRTYEQDILLRSQMN